jgi:hypothetical protein
MKKIVGLGALLSSVCFSVFAQVDTSFIYNTSMPYGTLDLRLAKSPTRYYYLQEGKTFSFRENSSGVRTNTYFDETSWDSSPYLQGNMREKNGSQDLYVMNYRLLPPANYDSTYEAGYPIIISIHGGGETGNCWNNNCIWANLNWNPNTNDPPAPTNANSELLNNDKNLIHGGQVHLNAVKLAGAKLPDDPTLPARAFPGFILAPQSTNGWLFSSKVEDAIRLVRLIIKRYNIDENRVYIHGLSNGAAGVNQAIKRAPWLFASALPMSAVTDGEIVENNMTAEVGKIPMRYYQGGKDTNPSPTHTFSFIKELRAAGANVQYVLYPNLGHGTWNTAYNERDFFSWILAQKKTNPHVFYGSPTICRNTGAGARLGFSNGFKAYQWEKNGIVIDGATQSEYIAHEPGVYRGRFSRVSASPTEFQWEEWSDEIVVSETEINKPTVSVAGSTHLRGPGLTGSDLNNTVILKADSIADLYYWYKNGQLVNFKNNEADDSVSTAVLTTGSVNDNGTYTLIVKKSNCPSPPSDPVNLFFNNSAPVNITLNAAAVNLQALPTASTVFLYWQDVSTEETGYEIWRRKKGTTDFIFAARTLPNAVSWLDSSLEPFTTYQYKIRAISSSGRSNYIPSDNINTNFEITTLKETTPVMPPQNLQVDTNGINTITLSWTAPPNNPGIKSYLINYGNEQIEIPKSPEKYQLTYLDTNAVYPITLQATSFAGKISSPSNQAIGNTFVSDLSFKHSTGAWLSLDDTTLIKTFAQPEFTGTIHNFSLTPRTQDDYFNFEFNGYLNLPSTGDYTFKTTSNDGSRLLIDDSLMVDNNGKHDDITVTGYPVRLASGIHAIKLQYFEYNGSQSLNVQIKGPGIADGNTFVTIPDTMLRTGTYRKMPAPLAPSNPVASAVGPQRLSVSWQFTDDNDTDFEIFRGEEINGVFSMVARVSSTSTIDSLYLIPGKTYFYKIRSVTKDGQSAFTNVCSVSNVADKESPGSPSGLTLLSKSTTSAAFKWTASNDNIAVQEYEVFANGQSQGTTPVPAFSSNFLTQNEYSFTVVAIDAAGNKSAPSAPLLVSNSIPGRFYARTSGDLAQTSAWSKYPDGTGDAPNNFTDNGQTFLISAETLNTLTNPLDISGTGSKIIVSSGATFNVAATCNCTIELQGNSILNLNSTTVPKMINPSQGSTVNFNSPNVIPGFTYGNLVLKGAGVKSFISDTTIVLGNFIIEDAATFSGSPVVKISGDAIFHRKTPYSNVNLSFEKNKVHALQAPGDLSFLTISAGVNSTVNLTSPDSVGLTLGAPTGGGLTLAPGSLLNIGKNSLAITGAGVINSANESGRLRFNNGNLLIESTTNANTNLYFDPSANIVNYFELNLRGAGKATIRQQLNISSGLKIKNGELNANAKLRLLATIENSAQIYQLENNSKLSGNISVQHPLPAVETWVDISLPVENVSVESLQPYFPVTGNFTGSSTGATLPSAPSMFTLVNSEMSAFPLPGGSNQSKLEKTKGYQSYIYSLNDSTKRFVEVTGTANQNNIAFVLNGGTDGSMNNGWNFIGNPYASTILISPNSGIQSSGLSNIVAIRQSREDNGESISQYKYYDLTLGNVFVEPFQAFWIQSVISNPSLNINETAKRNAVLPANESYGENHLMLSLSQGDKTDEAHIVFNPLATDSYDPKYDAIKRNNTGIFNLSTLTSNAEKVAFNTLNNNFCSKEVLINIEGTSPGSYSLSFQNFQSFSSMKITLRDDYTSTEIPWNGTPYNFSITTDPSSATGRFSILFSTKELNLNLPVSSKNACHYKDAEILIEGSEEDVTYQAMNGNSVVSLPATGNNSTIILTLENAKLVPGTNNIRVAASFNGCDPQLLTNYSPIHLSEPVSVSIESSISACPDAPVFLQAYSSENNSFNWYDETGTLITDVHGDSLSITLASGKDYFVSAVDSFGCESVKDTVSIYVTPIATPSVMKNGNTLYTIPADYYQWKKDGKPIEGATSDHLELTEDGLYSVVATIQGCSKESNGMAYVLSVEDNSSSNRFKIEIYPMPVTGNNFIVRITSKYTENFFITIVSAVGTEVYNREHTSRDASEGVTISPTTALHPGIYAIKISQHGKEITQKIVVRQ